MSRSTLCSSSPASSFSSSLSHALSVSIKLTWKWGSACNSSRRSRKLRRKAGVRGIQTISRTCTVWRILPILSLVSKEGYHHLRNDLDHRRPMLKKRAKGQCIWGPWITRVETLTTKVWVRKSWYAIRRTSRPHRRCLLRTRLTRCIKDHRLISSPRSSKLMSLKKIKAQNKHPSFLFKMRTRSTYQATHWTKAEISKEKYWMLRIRFRPW